MIPEAAVWLIWWLPLASFIVIAFAIRPFFNQHSIYAGYLTILSVAGSLVLSIWALARISNSLGLRLATLLEGL